MLFVLSAVVGGLLAGWLLGGTWSRLAALSLRSLWLLVVAVLIQAAGTLTVSGVTYVCALLVSLALAATFLAGNPQLAGRGLLLAGLAVNTLVVAANGAMPVVLVAAARAGVATGPLLDDPRHEIAGAGTRLGWLDDRIPLALPLEPQVVSVGDVLVAAGAGLLLAQGMRRRSAALAPVRVTAEAVRTN